MLSEAKELIQSDHAHIVTFGKAGKLEKQGLVSQPSPYSSHHPIQALILHICVSAAKHPSFLVSQLSFSTDIHPGAQPISPLVILDAFSPPKFL